MAENRQVLKKENLQVKNSKVLDLFFMFLNHIWKIRSRETVKYFLCRCLLLTFWAQQLKLFSIPTWSRIWQLIITSSWLVYGSYNQVTTHVYCLVKPYCGVARPQAQFSITLDKWNKNQNYKWAPLTLVLDISTMYWSPFIHSITLKPSRSNTLACAFPETTRMTSPVMLYCRDLIWWLKGDKST